MAALTGEYGHADTPAAVQRAEQVLGGQLHIGEEHLVELGLAGHLPQRPDLDAGEIHRTEEERDALVLLRLRVGASHEDAPVAVAPATAPHLLAVHHEPVAVALGLRGEPTEIAAGAGLAEQLAPQPVGRERGAEVVGLLLWCAEPQDRAAGEHQAHHVEERRHPDEGAFEHPHGVVLDGEASPAELAGPVDADVAGLVQTSVPCHALLHQVGRADGAVIARCEVLVGDQPLVCIGLEFVHRDHRRRP